MRLIYDVMAHPRTYIWIQRLLGADRLRRLCIEDFVRPKEGERILDLGCGPGQILDYLPRVAYVGFDTETRYIGYAKKHYADRGLFYCETFSERYARELEPFDAILALGLLHHLDNGSASRLLSLMSQCLSKGGRVVTLDPCFTLDQSAMARPLAQSDRGRFVRTIEAYDALVQPYFSRCEATVLHNTCRIPSTERIMLLSNPISTQGAHALSAGFPPGNPN